MNNFMMSSAKRIMPTVGLLLYAAAMVPTARAAATHAIDEHRTADPQGQVEIVVVAGTVRVVGWDKSEVAVTGRAGAAVEKVELSGSGSHTTLHVTAPKESTGYSDSWGFDPKAVDLTVQVPEHSSLAAELVSADLSVQGIDGDQDLHSVSGDVKSKAARQLRVRTVSGDMQLQGGTETRLSELSTVSGAVNLSGSVGEVKVQTVSGDARLELGALSRAEFKSVSGDFKVESALNADGRLEAESISGDVQIKFTGGVPPAAFNLRSFSGEIASCFGQKAQSDEHDSESHLIFTQGAGTAAVRVETKSGNITLCR